MTTLSQLKKLKNGVLFYANVYVEESGNYEIRLMRRIGEVKDPRYVACRDELEGWIKHLGGIRLVTEGPVESDTILSASIDE